MAVIDLLATFFIGWLAASGTMTIGFIVAFIRKRLDTVDIFWGISFIAVGVMAIFYNQRLTLPTIIAMTLITIWGVRLAFHIGNRSFQASRDDQRHETLRASWRTTHPYAYAYVHLYLLQALLATIIMVPALIIFASGSEGILALTIIGVVLWIVGFTCEIVGDHQLSRFVHTHPGKLMTSGLWSRTRHPNYFGEIIQWISIAVIALGIPNGWFGFVGPLVLAYLILYVSGIPLAEKSSRKKPGWTEYARLTPMLIPGFARSHHQILPDTIESSPARHESKDNS